MTNIAGQLLGGLVKLGQQAVTAAVASIDRLANRQEFDAVIAACVLIASADGTIDTTEKTAAIAQITAHPSLKGFSAAEIAKTFNDDVQLLGMDRVMGVETMLDKVRKVTDMPARTRLIGIATAIANADGKFTEDEKAMMERLRGIA